MNISCFPANQFWMFCVWKHRKPVQFKWFAAPGDQRRSLEADTILAEHRLRRWVDHLCLTEGQTISSISVRTVEVAPRPGNSVARLEPGPLWEVFKSFADYCSAELITCNLITVVNTETEYTIRINGWDKWAKDKRRMQPLRVGILAGFCDENRLPTVKQDQGEIALTAMQRVVDRAHKRIKEIQKAVLNGKAGEHELMGLADYLLVVAAEIAILPVPIEYLPYRKSSVDEISKVAETMSRHGKRKVECKVETEETQSNHGRGRG